MSTSVVLRVTPASPIDPDRWTGRVPEDVAAALRAADNQQRQGWNMDAPVLFG